MPARPRNFFEQNAPNAMDNFRYRRIFASITANPLKNTGNQDPALVANRAQITGLIIGE